VAAAESTTGYIQIDGAMRDELTKQLSLELEGYGLGMGSFALTPVKGLAKRLATRKLTGDRGAITDAAAPAAGDVLRFLARGDEARAFVRRAVEDIGGDVVLLGHSLGGVICVDLLLREELARVKGLVTIGSQAPLLYEIGALPALSHPSPVPPSFPAWLNIYDRRDLLAYVCADVFGRPVADDVPVDNKQPFPESHSAYWANKTVWRAVAGFLREHAN
jgi:pimeloyl-ACP methyl ester carboxylesterase